MKKIIPLIIALSLAGLGGASAQSTIFKTINSSEMNSGWLVASDLPGDGGAQVFSGPSPIAALDAFYSSPTNVTMSPSTTTQNAPAWWSSPENVGNKSIFGYLYATSPRGSLLGDTLSFEGIVTSLNLQTNAAGFPYSLGAYIQQFAPGGYTETFLPITALGTFLATLALDADPTATINWGLLIQGPNIDPNNTGELLNAGSASVEAIPEPSTYALLGLAAAGGLLVRRLRRKA